MRDLRFTYTSNISVLLFLEFANSIASVDERFLFITAGNCLKSISIP